MDDVPLSDAPGHGGRRDGAGRKPKDAAPPAEPLDPAKIATITPLEVMLWAMREATVAGKWIEAAALAKDVAPYIHPRRHATAKDYDGAGGASLSKRRRR